MNRGSTSAFQTEVSKAQNKPIHLVAIEFDSETFYLNDSYKTIYYTNESWNGLGHFLGFSNIEESAEVMVANMTLSLSGVDKTYISLFLSQNYIDRPVKVYKAFLDSSEDLVADPVLIFEGRMHQPTIEENPDSGTASISIQCTNAWIDFERKTGRHTNHEEQQIYFSGDKGFEFSSEIVQEINWGRTSES